MCMSTIVKHILFHVHIIITCTSFDKLFQFYFLSVRVTVYFSRVLFRLKKSAYCNELELAITGIAKHIFYKISIAPVVAFYKNQFY